MNPTVCSCDQVHAEVSGDVSRQGPLQIAAGAVEVPAPLHARVWSGCSGQGLDIRLRGEPATHDGGPEALDLPEVPQRSSASQSGQVGTRA